MIRYTPPEDAVEIPVVDYAGAFSPDSADRRRVADAIGAACRQTGFFYVSNHGLPPGTAGRLLEAGRRFFALPLAKKAAVVEPHGRGRRGYEPMAAQALDDGSPPDLKEAVMFGSDSQVWPALPGFEAELRAYMAAMAALGQRLAGSLALSLALPEDYFAAALARPNVTTRLLRYPPHPAAAEVNQLGSGAHTDWGLLTLLLQDAIGGLEVRTVDGRWIRAVPVPDTLVVNLGDMVPHLTGGLYRSNFHRVLNNAAGEDRYSVATFFNPAGDVAFDCVPSCRPAGWVPSPRTVDEHVRARIARTYGTPEAAPRKAAT